MESLQCCIQMMFLSVGIVFLKLLRQEIVKSIILTSPAKSSWYVKAAGTDFVAQLMDLVMHHYSSLSFMKE